MPAYRRLVEEGNAPALRSSFAIALLIAAILLAQALEDLPLPPGSPSYGPGAPPAHPADRAVIAAGARVQGIDAVAPAPNGTRVLRLDTVPLSPRRPAFLSSSAPAWLAYDLPDQIFYVAAPPSTVDVVPGSDAYAALFVVDTVTVGQGPFGVAYDNSTGEVFVTNSGSGNVSIIDGHSSRLLTSIDVGTSPMGVTYDPVDGQIYVANNGSGTVSVLSTAPLKVIATVPVGTNPIGVAADPATGDVFVANHGSNNATVISGSTHKVLANIRLAGGPYGVTVDTRSDEIYITEGGASQICAIGGSNFSVVANISIPNSEGVQLQGLAFDTGDGLVYAGGGYGDVSIIDPANQSVVGVDNFDPDGVAYDPTTGDVCVTNAANASFECAAFYPGPPRGPYKLWVNETGLPANSEWSVDLDGEPRGGNGFSFVFNVSNGTYPFRVYGDSVSYFPDPDQGLVTVDGHNTVQQIAISGNDRYVVKIIASGLPGGQYWDSEVDGTVDQAYSDGGAAWFNLTNGTYQYGIGVVPPYVASPAWGNVTVDGAPVTVNATYSIPPRALYPVTFLEEGLPIGTLWTVALGQLESSTRASYLEFNESNGTYDFSVAATGFVANESTGNFTLNGTGARFEISFAGTELFRLTFRETGLPAGTEWAVLLGGALGGAVTANISFDVLNGTYGYLVLPPSGYVSAVSGRTTINGTDVTVVVPFTVPAATGNWLTGEFPAAAWAITGAAVAAAVILGALLAVRSRRPPSPPTG